jgi:hypothetical protein
MMFCHQNEILRAGRCKEVREAVGTPVCSARIEHCERLQAQWLTLSEVKTHWE